MVNEQGDLIFALDIGTRTIIGLVIEYTNSKYNIIASEVVEHEHRVMLDGQIHNVNEVVEEVKKIKIGLEKKMDLKLERVVIAAAGRALKTLTGHYTIELEEKRIITHEDVQTLEFSAVQKVQGQLVADKKVDLHDYHFVGYSVIEYLLDGIYLGNLEGQKGKKLELTLISTFLPRIVIESLLTVIDLAGLEVEFLTLEPIAAANVVIPKDMFNFNLALVDIGAGTSDIALTKGGSMIGYAMAPFAGDEITEALAEYYLLDFYTGERLKCSFMTGKKEILVRNILSQEVAVSRDEAIAVIKPKVKEMAQAISELILSLNKKSPQAIICIGGGSLTPCLPEKLANFLGMDPKRVGIKEYEDLKNISGLVNGVSSTQAITPLGIALSSHQNTSKADFLEVDVNDRTIQLFTLNKPSIADALLAAEIDIKGLRGRPGMGLTCSVNGQLKTIKGTLGQPGLILLNDKEVELTSSINPGDKINVKPALNGRDASGIITDILPKLKNFKIKVNGTQVELKSLVYQNGQLVDEDETLIDGAKINFHELKTIRDGIAQILEVSPELLNKQVITFSFNGEKQYLPRGKYLILLEGKPVDLDQALINDLNLQLLKTSDEPITIKKAYDIYGNKGNIIKEITITFNGNQLNIPIKKWDILCNDQRVDFAYEIKDEDRIECNPKAITIKQVFDFINYKISTTFNNFELRINGKVASIEDLVMDGDDLKIFFN